MVRLYDSTTEEPVCNLKAKEALFLDENLDGGFPEGESRELTDDDMIHLVVCDAQESLVEKLKKVLGDEIGIDVYWERD